jgi:hypothetical protein
MAGPSSRDRCSTTRVVWSINHMAAPQPPTISRQPESLFTKAARWLATHLAASLVAAAGVLLYGVLRVSYARFYGRFDVEPEEVGLGQTEILTQTGVLLFVSVSLAMFLLGILFLIMRTLGVLPVTATAKVLPGAPLWRRAMAFTTTPYWMVVIPTIWLLAFYVLVELPGRATSLADRVESGEAVRPPASILHWNLAVEALPARLTSPSGNSLPPQLRSRSLRYLGKAGGMLVLYDWRTARTVRVPEGSVVVTTSK